MQQIPVVVTGFTGRLGGLLRRAWQIVPSAGLAPVWCGRRPGAGADLVWNILDGPAPLLPPGAVILHLAAVLRGDAAALAANAAMAAPVLAAARQSGARAVLFASTAAVYAPSAVPATEDTPPAPANAYGRAKLAAEMAFLASGPVPVSRLRIGNVVGADALLGPRATPGPLVLDPVPGRAGGPVRSWIGPQTLAQVLAALCHAPSVPPVLNLAADPPLPMADLLTAAGRDWTWGPPNPAVVPDAILSVARLAARMPLPAATPAALIAELARLKDLP